MKIRPRKIVRLIKIVGGGIVTGLISGFLLPFAVLLLSALSEPLPESPVLVDR